MNKKRSRRKKILFIAIRFILLQIHLETTGGEKMFSTDDGLIYFRNRQILKMKKHIHKKHLFGGLIKRGTHSKRDHVHIHKHTCQMLHFSTYAHPHISHARVYL